MELQWWRICFPSYRGLSFEGPLLTPVSWKRWRKLPRTSATTWTLPKAWTPTKTRSITLQTEWPHLCDLLTSHVFTSCIFRCCPAQTLPFPPPFGSPTTPPSPHLPVWPTPPFLYSGIPVSFLHLQPFVKCVEVSQFGLLCLSPFN